MRAGGRGRSRTARRPQRSKTRGRGHGWYDESRRHSLAARGVRTAHISHRGFRARGVVEEWDELLEPNVVLVGADGTIYHVQGRIDGRVLFHRHRPDDPPEAYNTFSIPLWDMPNWAYSSGVDIVDVSRFERVG